MRVLTSVLLGLVALATSAPAQEAGEVGGPGLALLTRKALVASLEGDTVVDNALLLVKDGRIEAIGDRKDVQVPEGYEVLDLGNRWVAPGLVDLHNHVAGGLGDLNDMVYMTNPGLRAAPTITPGNGAMKVAIAGGVTSVLLIPGSGTNMGGQGILVRGGFDTFEENLIRNPGSLKLAQAGNPERRAPWYPGRSFMNYNTRNTFQRGVTYAKKWEAYEAGVGPKPEKDIQFEVFRHLRKGEAQVSTHTQIYQVVNKTIEMVAEEMELPVYIDHGTFDGYRAAARAAKSGVHAILGPRQIQAPSSFRPITEGRVQGIAAGYQERGHPMIGFNTDAPVVPQEELSVQAAMGVRYGFQNDQMQAVRGLTSVPAITAGLYEAIGSLEVGKDADILVITGDPVDPRTSIEMVFQRGVRVYDTGKNTRRW
ncbi:MAG: amidohydrolase family protein [Planctomycetota bacterium]|nr:amidohydrolase family protein [Planctomycetota bacterium]